VPSSQPRKSNVFEAATGAQGATLLLVTPLPPDPTRTLTGTYGKDWIQLERFYLLTRMSEVNRQVV